MSLQNKKIAFLGAGNMGEAMLRGLIASKLSVPSDLLACDLREERLSALSSELGVKGYVDARQAAKAADIIVLAVKPQAFPELLKDLAGQISAQQAVLSIAAGIPIAKIEAALGAVPVLRAMPNTPALIGQGASAYCLGSKATDAQASQAEALLGCLGLVLRVSEDQINAVTALSGSGPAYVFLFMEALQAAGAKLGLSPEASFELAAKTLSGAAAMIAQKKDSPSVLREKVTSPGGTTAAALKVFEEAGLKEIVLKAMTAARDRGAELGKS
jgi:pyrroline-5-carboxylate reductase